MITSKDLNRKKEHGEVGHLIEVSCMKCYNEILTNHYKDGCKDTRKEFIKDNVLLMSKHFQSLIDGKFKVMTSINEFCNEMYDYLKKKSLEDKNE